MRKRIVLKDTSTKNKIQEANKEKKQNRAQKMSTGNSIQKNIIEETGRDDYILV